MEGGSCVLGPVTSLLLWRAVASGLAEEPRRDVVAPDLSGCVGRVRQVRRIPVVASLGDVPLDVVVGSPRLTHRCRSLDAIVLRGELPAGSFCQVEAGVYACAPELCFLLLGRGGDWLHLAEVGNELCGGYALSHDQTGSYVVRPQLTTHARLEAYVREARGRHGRKVALEALREVCEGSDSPAETSKLLAWSTYRRMCDSLGARDPSYGTNGVEQWDAALLWSFALGSRWVDHCRYLLDSERWQTEHGRLRIMAGYERRIVRRSPGTCDAA